MLSYHLVNNQKSDILTDISFDTIEWVIIS